MSARAELGSAATGLAPLPTPLSDIELTLDPKPIAYFGRGRVSEVGSIASSTGGPVSYTHLTLPTIYSV